MRWQMARCGEAEDRQGCGGKVSRRGNTKKKKKKRGQRPIDMVAFSPHAFPKKREWVIHLHCHLDSIKKHQWHQ